MEIATLAALVGIVVGLISIGSAVTKVASGIGAIRKSIDEVEEKISRLELETKHEVDLLKLTINGVRERMEHINTRVSGQLKDRAGALEDVELFLAKTTPYERRR